MDLNDLKSTVSNLTLYDLKAGFRKAQNAVMNYTEMEAKVREATNNEPWGASSSLMQEIANGTFNYSTLNEIMPMIYRRFTEKSAEEWRQIYKALQLLEFLIKHGSERVIDDARGHIALLKMLRAFQFIDLNGKDQGINVRNRAKELADLLSDVDRIRTERKKARATKNKYTGVEGGTFSGGFSGGSGRYGGFGSESAGYGAGSADFGGYSGGVYGDGGGFGGQQSDWQESSSSRADRFEEYDEFDEAERPPRRPSRRGGERAGVKKTTPAPPPKKKEPEVDLFSFDDAEQTSGVPTATANGSDGLASVTAPQSAAAATNDDDEFDDFQSATPAAQTSQPSALNPPVTSMASATTQMAAPQPLSAPQQNNINQMVNMTSPTSTPGANYSAFTAPAQAPAKPVPQSNYQPAGPNYFGGVQAQQTSGAVGGGINQSAGPSGMSAMSPTGAASGTTSTMANTKPVTNSQTKAAGAGGDAFGALWGKASSGIKKANTPSGGPAMGQLAREKSSAGIWGAPAANSTAPPANSSAGGGSASDDLLG